jgi:formylglycine-generating enzyme required for sulfatase activity
MTIKLFLLAIIFVITGGSLFTEMFKKHKILGFLAGLIVVASAYYLIEDIYDEIIETVTQKIAGSVNENHQPPSDETPFWLDHSSHEDEKKPPLVVGQTASEYEIGAYFDKALTYVENDKLDKAYTLFKEIPPSHEKAQLLSEKMITALEKKAAVQMSDRKYTTPKKDNAFESYSLLLKINPNHDGAKKGIAQIIESYYELAFTSQEKGDFDEAKKWIERGLSLDASNGKLRALKIKIALEEEIKKLVENYYQQALSKDNRGEYQESMALIQHGLSLNPTHEKLRALSEKVGLALKKRQEIDNYYQLALAKVNKKAYEAAMVWIDKGLSLEPSHKKLQALKRQISRTGTQYIYTNSIGMKFKLIKAGKFQMGSKNGSSDEQPVHWVEISKDFYMGVYEVTVGAYKKYVDEKGGHFEPRYNKQGDNAAITGVSWEDAQGFISWLNEKEGGEHYRLPTEAEWEYAARAGTTTEYSFGDDSSLLGDYAWYWDNRKGNYAHIVGQKKSNPWGLYDMHGNVWEWVQDWYNSDYYSSSVLRRDPKGPGAGSYRVFRGGGWYNGASSCRAAYRIRDSPGLRYGSLGFRLLRQP